MNKPITTLNAYADGFRDLVNARVWARNERAWKALKLHSEADWSFVCAAMDVVGDASLAIENFLRFGLNGPSRYEDIGERYLRLYGMLNAAYVQQQAVLQLYRLMNCPNPKAVRANFDGLEVRTLRHQLASHSLDCFDRGTGSMRAFVPVRLSLDGYTCTVAEARADQGRKFKLDEALDAHCKAVIDVIDVIYEKSIRTLFKGQMNRLKEFQKKLEGLRFVRDGNVIIGVGGGNKGMPHEIRIALDQTASGRPIKAGK